MAQAKVDELREESLLLCSDDEIEDWSPTSELLGESLNLSYKPNIIVLTKKRAVVEIENMDD